MNAWDDLSEAARELMCERSELDIAQDHVTLTARYAEVAAERDRLAAGVPLVCSDERHEAKVRGLEAQLAAVRALAEQLIANGCPWAGNVPGVGEDLLEILGGPPASVAVKAMPFVPVSQEDIDDWALGTPTDPAAS